MGFSLPRHLLQFVTRKPYGIHSPFLFDFAEKCLYADVNDPAFEGLENIRKELKRSRTFIYVKDFGAGNRLHSKFRSGPLFDRRRSIRGIARRALQNPRYCRLLFRIARYRRPDRILELGTSMGISASYLGAGAPAARVVTLEGCPNISAIARKVFQQAGLNHIELITGPFNEQLPWLLQKGFRPDLVYIDGHHTFEGLLENYFSIREHISPSGVVIIDDIRWSGGMWKAWKEVVSAPEVRLSVDLGKMGLLFFDPGLSKENIVLGF
jgi:predicted O-methyltransferase YrrM